jgi:hypothetical protein
MKMHAENKAEEVKGCASGLGQGSNLGSLLPCSCYLIGHTEG